MDAIFEALNDPTPRQLRNALRARDGQTLAELENRLEMTRFGVMKHLRLLEEAGLVVSVKRGRFKHHSLNAVPLQEVIDRWIEPFLARPAARALLSLKSDLERTSPIRDTADMPVFVQQTFIPLQPGRAPGRAHKGQPDGRLSRRLLPRRGRRRPGGETRFLRADGTTMLTQKTLRTERRSLVETSFEPAWGGDGTPSRVAFRVKAEGAFCKLTTEHDDLPEAQAGVHERWARWASSLKSRLETGEPLRAGA